MINRLSVVVRRSILSLIIVNNVSFVVKCYISLDHLSFVICLLAFVVCQLLFVRNNVEIYVRNNIAREPLLGETSDRALCISSFIRNVSKFHTNTYPSLFVSLMYIHLNHRDIHGIKSGSKTCSDVSRSLLLELPYHHANRKTGYVLSFEVYLAPVGDVQNKPVMVLG